MQANNIGNKIIRYMIPLLVLVVFVVIMQGGIYKLGSQDNKNKVYHYKSLLASNIEAEKWTNASADFDELEVRWNKLIPRLEYHAEMNAITGIDVSLGRLKGFIAAHDKGGALAELGEINKYLDNLTE